MSIALQFCRFAALLIAALALAPSAVAQSKTFVWDDSFRSGDCGSDTVSVVLDSNGAGHRKSISWTRSSVLGKSDPLGSFRLNPRSNHSPVRAVF